MKREAEAERLISDKARLQVSVLNGLKTNHVYEFISKNYHL